MTPRPATFCAASMAALLACCLMLQPAAAASGGGANASKRESKSAIDVSPVAAAPRSNGLPEGWSNGVFMEIFVRAWKDSDGDGIGDLKGLIQTLPYLQELGIRGLWLMPITANADGDHGYATTNFRDVAPEYGTLSDLDELLKQAHRRGIGIVMDYVINHSAAGHPMFTEALKGRDNPFRPWFVWSDTAPPGWDIWGKYPWYHVGAKPWLHTGEVKDLALAPVGAKDFYFGTFGPHMPDFDFRHPAVLEYHLSSLRFWLNRGLDGYRLDAVPHLIENSAKDWNDQPQSRALTKQMQDLILSYPQRYVVCEATAEPQQYGDPQVCGGAFAFGHVHHYVQAALGQTESVQKVADYFLTASPRMATFVSNHDLFAGRRLWDQVAGDERRYKLAAAGYLLQPGTPFIYYGEEVGQAGVHTLPGDLPLRSPMSWTADPRTAGFTRGQPFRPTAPNVATHNLAAQRKDPNSIFHFYQAMVGLRNALPSIARGSYEGAFASGQLAGWQRAWKDERTLVLINYGTQSVQTNIPALPPGARLQAVWPRWAPGAQASADGQASVRMPAQAVQVWRVVPMGGDRAAAKRK